MDPALDEAVEQALAECVLALRPDVSDRARELARRLAQNTLDRLRANGGDRVPVAEVHEVSRG